jgi:acetyltransferase-like isoleucine patch superfamily enzyme
VSAILKQCERLRSTWAIARGRIVAHLWAARGARIGAKTCIGRQCIVDRPWCVEMGDRVLLEPDVYLKITADDASLRLGDFVFVGRGVEFDVLDHVTVGAHTMIAPRCFITDHNHGTLAAMRIDGQSGTVGRIAIGADVWLGTAVVVLPGVSIGDGAVVGANSVVTKDVAPMTIVAGVPAQFLRMRIGAGSR